MNKALAFASTVLALPALLPASAQGATSTPAPPASLGQTQPTTPIEHFIVLMQENHTFDNYFGTFPGADGFPPGTCVPVNPLRSKKPCVKPFPIGKGEVADLDHGAATHDRQYNKGRMDGFVHALNQRNQDGALAMGYYDDKDIPVYWDIARRYVLFDRFFSSARGGSVWNHMYWVTGTPGNPERNSIPPEGFGNIPTIFDRLEQRGITWKFYVQNYDPKITFRTLLGVDANRASQVVWVPLLDYARYIDDPKLFARIVDMEEYYADLRAGTLPAVSYLVPSGASEHPPGSIQAGQTFVGNLINALMRSSAWNSSAFMWTYDDWGGWYDHVPPPVVDEFGYGFRVPTLMVSPYARKGYIDRTELDFTSILKFIELNWRIKPLAKRDAVAKTFMGAFDFDQPPRPARFVTAPLKIRSEARHKVAIFAPYSAALFLAGLTLVGIRRDRRSS